MCDWDLNKLLFKPCSVDYLHKLKRKIHSKTPIIITVFFRFPAIVFGGFEYYRFIDSFLSDVSISFKRLKPRVQVCYRHHTVIITYCCIQLCLSYTRLFLVFVWGCFSVFKAICYCPNSIVELLFLFWEMFVCGLGCWVYETVLETQPHLKRWLASLRICNLNIGNNFGSKRIYELTASIFCENHNDHKLEPIETRCYCHVVRIEWWRSD